MLNIVYKTTFSFLQQNIQISKSITTSNNKKIERENEIGNASSSETTFK